MSLASAAALDEHHDADEHHGAAPGTPCCGHCNHGCHAVSHLLTHLNSFPTILTIVPLATPVASLLATPVFFLLAEAFFKPPR